MKEKVNGVEIYYHKLGKGEPLLLLHGHHLDGGMFDKIVAPLSLYYTVYVLDMRGHGLSEGDIAEHYKTEVEDVYVFVNGAGIRPYHYLTEGFHRFLRLDRDSRVELTESFISVDDLKKITTPTLCVVGEKDWVKVEHVRWYSQFMPNARLVIMPRQTHDSYAVRSLKLLDLIKGFCR